MGQTQSSCGFRQVYSLHLIKHNRQGLAANRPDPVRILDVGKKLQSMGMLKIENIWFSVK